MIEVLEKQIPVIRDFLMNKILPEVKGRGVDLLQNEKQLRAVFSKAYGVLPFAVKLVVG